MEDDCGARSVAGGTRIFAVLPQRRRRRSTRMRGLALKLKSRLIVNVTSRTEAGRGATYPQSSNGNDAVRIDQRDITMLRSILIVSAAVLSLASTGAYAGNSSSIVQNGNGNAAETFQRGRNNDSQVVQFGNGNGAGVHQVGKNNNAGIGQNGDGNYAGVWQRRR